MLANGHPCSCELLGCHHERLAFKERTAILFNRPMINERSHCKICRRNAFEEAGLSTDRVQRLCQRYFEVQIRVDRWRCYGLASLRVLDFEQTVSRNKAKRAKPLRLPTWSPLGHARGRIRSACSCIKKGSKGWS